MDLFTPTGPRSSPLADRIEPDDRDCWIWIGSRTNGDYGTVYVEGDYWLTHRLVYTLLVGPIPSGLTIDHLCRVHACCNPDHLEPVTLKENIRRGVNTITHRNLPGWREKTHCVHGHEYTDVTRYRYEGTGKISCRTCKNIRDRKRRADKRLTDRR